MARYADSLLAAEIEPITDVVRELLLNIAEQYDKLADHLSRTH
jgi:hypothetical protein